MPVSAEKSALRREILLRRQQVSAQERLARDVGIFENVQQCAAFLQADAVFCFVSEKGEPDTRRLIEFCLAMGIRLAVPRCMDKNGAMAFFWITAEQQLVPGFFGIPEPDEHCPPAAFTPNTCCFVPALAFDRKGNRLGYGKGYYDRFLAGFCGHTIGLCDEEFLFNSLPADEFDRQAEEIVTEHNRYTTR